MLNEKLENALKHPKTTFQGIVALIAAVALIVFAIASDGLNAQTLSEGGGAVVLLLASFQRIFLSKDKPEELK